MSDVNLDQLVEEMEAAASIYLNFKTMSAGDDMVEKIVDLFDLRLFWTFFQRNSTSHDLPYHNLYHTKCMILNAFEASVWEDLEWEDAQVLIVACMFHDFSHSGGEHDDAHNIKIAQLGLYEAWNECVGLSDAQYKLAREIIGVTQYPYVRKPVTLLEKIIRDADLMQIYEVDDEQILKQYLGLKSEIERKVGKPIDRKVYADGQMAWWQDNVHWYSEWARMKANCLNDEAAMRNLANLLSGDACK